MDSNDHKNKKDDDQRRKEHIQQRTMTYQTCAKHGRRFPDGDSCPQCDAEKRNPNKSDR